MPDTNEDLAIFNQILQQRYVNAVLECAAKDARVISCERRIEELEAKMKELENAPKSSIQA